MSNNNIRKKWSIITNEETLRKYVTLAGVQFYDVSDFHTFAANVIKYLKGERDIEIDLGLLKENIDKLLRLNDTDLYTELYSYCLTNNLTHLEDDLSDKFKGDVIDENIINFYAMLLRIIIGIFPEKEVICDSQIIANKYNWNINIIKETGRKYVLFGGIELFARDDIFKWFAKIFLYESRNKELLMKIKKDAISVLGDDAMTGIDDILVRSNIDKIKDKLIGAFPNEGYKNNTANTANTANKPNNNNNDGYEFSISNLNISNFKRVDIKTLFSNFGIVFYQNFISLFPEIKKIIGLLNQRCSENSQLTVSYEPIDIYGKNINYNVSSKVKQKKYSNKKFQNSLFFGYKGKSSKYLKNYMILCLNKKKKTKMQSERECLSSIMHWFMIANNGDFKIIIDSKTSHKYEGKKYNKLLRLLTILIYYYLYTRYKHIIFNSYNSQEINNIYIESQAINPISALLLLKMNFKVVNPKTYLIDDELTQDLKHKSYDEIKNIMYNKPFYSEIYLRYYINEMTPDDAQNIITQIKSLIIGKTANNNKTLKCLNNSNNRLTNKTVRNNIERQFNA